MKTYAVVIPVLMTIEVEAATKEAAEAIATLAFDQNLSYDPLSNVKIPTLDATIKAVVFEEESKPAVHSWEV